MPLRLLAVGDMHLGRRPSRLPPALTDRARELGPAGAWSRVVETAIEAEVDAVALAGDVVDQEKDFFEAFRDLRLGVERLAAADIRVLGVAGNHDVTVLPRLAAQIKSFELLGGNGEWQAAEIDAGGETATLWGWSFPRARFPESPLSGVEFARGPGPNLGLLHCDRDQANSPYAPVSGLELEAAGLDGWLLGHIHQPDILDVANPSGYLGSVTGTDPGEPGARGPWLVTIDSGRIREVEQWVMAPLRYERFEVDIEGISEPEEAREYLLDGLREIDARAVTSRCLPTAVGLRVAFIGRSRFGNAAVTLFSGEDREHVYSGEGGTHYFIERLEAETNPEISLDVLAERADPPGLLARQLLLLDSPNEVPERQELLVAARRTLEVQARKPQWSGLRVDPMDDAIAADWLRDSGTRLLEKLLLQQEVAD